MKAFVASRNEGIRIQVSELLNLRHHDVKVTDRASHLISSAVGEDFDLVVIDTDLSGLDGVESLSILRRVRPGLPIVIVSGETTDQVSRQIALEGAFYHFHKPLYDADFLNVVDVIARKAADPST